VAACAVAIVVLPLQLARAYQSAKVRPMLASYLTAPKSPLVPSALTDATVMFASRPIDAFDSDVIDVEVDRDRCAGDASLSFVYDPAYPASDYSRVLRLPSPPRALGVTHVVFTAYEHFHGVRFPEGMKTCVVGAYRLTDLRPYDVLVDATLPPGWEQGPMYQRLTGWSPVWFD
jgi:hypothetical protein